MSDVLKKLRATEDIVNGAVTINISATTGKNQQIEPYIKENVSGSGIHDLLDTRLDDVSYYTT